MTQNSTISQMQKWNKRFKLSDDAKGVIDSFDDSEIWTVHPNEAYNLCILLNELHNENERLKKQLSQLNEENGKLFADYSKIILGDAE